jgi:methyl-accepting chemotaxis protein
VRQGAEQVATAAEEQSAAVAEAQAAIRQQSQSLDQGQLAARSLTALSGQLRTGIGDTEAAAIRIGPMAEELSASIRQLSTAAAQIMSAVAQINRGARMQAAATQQRSAALAQIERGAGSARDNAGQAIDRVGELAHAAAKGRAVVDRLVEGATQAAADTGASPRQIASLETMSRRIDKIVDGIALIAVQTSMLAVSGAVEAARC